jgi:Spy/CpxP family protein refolding chaperone
MIGTYKRIVFGMGATAIAVVTAVGLSAAGQKASGVSSFSPQGGPGIGRGRGGPGRLGWRGGLMGPGAPALMDLALGRLNLSDAQKDQVKAIMQSHQEELKALGDRAMAAHDALEAAVTADAPDEATIRAKSSEVAAVDADTAVARARIRVEIFQILTAEQQAQAKQMQAEMKQRLEQMRQRRPGR